MNAKRFAPLLLLASPYLFGLVLALFLMNPVLAEPSEESDSSDSEAVPVVVWNREITRLRASYKHMTPEKRAAAAVKRILEIPPRQGQYHVEAKDGTLENYSGAWILVNDRIALSLLREDADTEMGQTFENLKQQTVDNLKSWLEAREQQQKWPLFFKGLGLTIAATLLFVMAIVAGLRFGNYWLNSLNAAIKNASTRPTMIGDVNIKPYLIHFEIGVFKLIAWIIGLALGYLWLTFVLNQFPYSQPWGASLTGFLVQLFAVFASGIIQSIPNLFTVLVIYLLTRLIVQVVKAFFTSAETGSLTSAWLQPETARTTRRLVVVLIWIFAMVVAYPYIPGSQTEAFKGVSVFVGLMLSLGSAGMVGQIVGGIVVVYSRAFRIGEYVRIGEYEGTIREIGVLSTKMLTNKLEEITIPNAVLVGATTVNYSRHADESGAIVSTSVTIGYDTPWRQVHALLLLAADRTARILNEPAPRIMQRSLSDFYVEYHLFFRIEKAEQRYWILSELHSQIQDAFNEYGVQIMSPHFEMQPDTTVVVPEADWRKPPACDETR